MARTRPRWEKLRHALFYQLFARGLFSGVLTSIGEMKPPPALEERVTAVDILACNSPAPGRNTSMFSFKGKLGVAVGSSVEDLRLEEKFAEGLRDMGVVFETFHKREPDGS